MRSLIMFVRFQQERTAIMYVSMATVDTDTEKEWSSSNQFRTK